MNLFKSIAKKLFRPKRCAEEIAAKRRADVEAYFEQVCMNRKALFEIYREQIDAAVAKARAEPGPQHEDHPSGNEVYAYSLGDGRIAWGVNGGAAVAWKNILRGCRHADGRDHGVS